MGAAESNTVLCGAPRCVDLRQGGFAGLQTAAQCDAWPERERLYFLHDDQLHCANLRELSERIQHEGNVAPWDFTEEQLRAILERAWALQIPGDVLPAPSGDMFVLQGSQLVVRAQSRPGSQWPEVHLFGEDHRATHDCPSVGSPVIKLAEYLQGEIGRTPHFIDLFVEVEPFQWDDHGHMASAGESQLIRVRNTFMPCLVGPQLRRQPTCVYPNLRAHAVDVREFGSDLVEGLREVRHYTRLDMGDTDPEEFVGILSEALPDLKVALGSLVSLLPETAPQFLGLMVHESQDIQKQFSKLAPELVDSLMSYASDHPGLYGLEGNAYEPFDYVRSKRRLVKLFGRLEAAEPQELVAIFDQLFALVSDMIGVGLSPLVDIYTLARILRSYHPRETGPGAEHPTVVTRAIYVAGSAHVRWTADFLKSIPDYELVEFYSPISCMPLVPKALFP